MTPATVLALIAQYGPTVLPLIQNIVKWVEEGKKEVTSEDIAVLIAYGQKTAADYLKEAGVVLPPSSTTP